MSVTYSLSKTLQDVQLDLFAAMEEVQRCIDIFQEMRENDDTFPEIYERAVEIASRLGVEPAKTRTVGTQ